MPISAIVITLAPAPHGQLHVLRSLRSLPGLWLGTPCGARLPAVLDCLSVSASRDLFDQLLAIDGVAQVELVCVNFDDAAGDAGPCHGNAP